VLPAHFSGPADADAGGLVRASLGALRAASPELGIEDAAELVERLRAGAREPPAAYAAIVRANLGLLEAGEDAAEWELGKNECAAHAPR
jgi:hypothetical protein